MTALSFYGIDDMADSLMAAGRPFRHTGTMQTTIRNTTGSPGGTPIDR
ncbi:hypothetical protein [Roseibium sp.]